MAAQITIRPDLAVLADDHIALDEHPGQDPGAGPKMEHTLDHRRRMHLAADVGRSQRRNVLLVGPQEVPGMPDEK